MRELYTSFSRSSRSWLFRIAGILILMIGAGAALLPKADQVGGGAMVGTMLLSAGLVELLAGSFRRSARTFAMAAGIVTTLAGSVFILNRVEHFFATVYVVAAWLFARSVVLALGAAHSEGAVRMWTIASAGTDLALGLVLVFGVAVSTLVVTLFGPTPPVVASFAWILAISMIVTGLLLLEIASCERPRSSLAANLDVRG